MDEQAIGERLVLETEQVRIWEDIVEPGTEQAVHTHRNPYVSVMVTPARGQIIGADGSVMYDVDRQPGESRWFGPERMPVTHTLRNTGDSVIRVVVIEVLAP